MPWRREAAEAHHGGAEDVVGENVAEGVEGARDMRRRGASAMVGSR